MLLAGVPAQYGVPVGYPPFEQVSDFSAIQGFKDISGFRKTVIIPPAFQVQIQSKIASNGETGRDG